jgi:hypothetical protein
VFSDTELVEVEVMDGDSFSSVTEILKSLETVLSAESVAVIVIE